MASLAFWLLSLLLCIAPLLAQDGPPTPPEVTTPKPKVVANGRITGTVLCGDTRKPARGALLLISLLPAADGSRPLEGGRDNTTRVGLDGTFTAEHLAPGEYGIMSIFPGYLSPFDNMVGSQMGNQSPVEQRAILGQQGSVVIRGAETETLNLTLVRGAAVSGRVFYSDGTPAAQVSIGIENVATKANPGDSPEDSMNVGRVFRATFTQQSFSTDDRGQFRLAGLQPGTYRVAAIQSFGASNMFGGEGMAMMFGSLADTSALHFYSGDTLHRKAAKTYELRSGDELTGIDIIIPDRAFHHIRGRVVSASGKPANSGQATLTDKSDETFTYHQGLGDDGVFDFPVVPSGSYTLTIQDAGYTNYAPGSDRPSQGSRSTPQSIAFGPGTQDLIVKESDVVDLNLTLPELPPTPAGKRVTP